MATHLDLEEQEQLDELKHFWKQYGNVITWVLIAVLLGVSAWNGYSYWQRQQAAKAAAIFDEFEKSLDGEDVERNDRVFSDLRDKFPSSLYTHQAALMLAEKQFRTGAMEKSAQSLQWVVSHAGDAGYVALAQLRLAAVQAAEKKYTEALKTLDAVEVPEFLGLAADRRGDVLVAQNQPKDAITAYRKAYDKLEEGSEYRRLVIVKLNALGVDPIAIESSK